MSKFNMNKIKGMNESVNKTFVEAENSDKEDIQVGKGLLSAVPKVGDGEEMEMKYILVRHIHPSPKNKVSIRNIEELADNIYDIGLLNAPIVKLRDDGEYDIVAGERRHTACTFLITTQRWSEDKQIRCSVFNPDLIHLNLSNEDKEELVRLSENVGQRDKTDADKIILMRGFRELYDKLRAKGELKGKTKDLLAADMKEARTTISNMMKVESKAAEEVMDAILGEKLSIRAATKVVDMPKEEQKEFAESLEEGKVSTEKDLQVFQARKKRKKQMNPVKEGVAIEGHGLDKKIFRKDTKTLLNVIGDGMVVLDDAAYVQYKKHLDAIKVLLEKAVNV